MKLVLQLVDLTLVENVYYATEGSRRNGEYNLTKSKLVKLLN